MKKLLLSLGVFASLSLSAQTLVNGSFEAAMTPNANFPEFTSTTGWFGWYTSAETVAPFAGAQAAKIETKIDATTNSLFGLGATDPLTGYFDQTIDGGGSAIAHPENIEVSVMYKFTSVNGDSASIVVEVYDTLAAGNSDDVLLYFGYLDLFASVATYTNGVITMTADATGTGTANYVDVYAVSSQSGWFNANIPEVGNTLWMDDMSMTNYAASVKENNEIVASVFPNPTNDFLNFKINRDVKSMEIISMDGKVVISAEFNSTVGAVNVSSLDKGVYTYVLTTVKGEKSTSTFVKK